MLHIPRTKNEETTHAPLNNVALAALKAVPKHGEGKGRVFRSRKTGEPLENGRHWSDDGVIAAELKNFQWHDLGHTFASHLQMKGAPLEDIADLPGRHSLRMARRHAHPGTNKPHAVASLVEASGTRTDTGHSEGQTATAQGASTLRV